MRQINRIAATGAAAIIACALMVAAPASAADLSPLGSLSLAGAPLPAELEAKAIAKMNELGVDASKQAGLLAKLAAGVPLDSEAVPAVAPVAVSEYRIGVTDYIREVFPDGSVSLGALEHPVVPTTGGNPSARSISGCTYSLSAGVATNSNCKISHSSISYDFYFRASYYQAAGGAKITSVNPTDWQLNATIDDCSMQSLGKTSETSARLTGKCVFMGMGSRSQWVNLSISKTSATETANF